MPSRFLRIAEVKQRTGLSVPTVYRLIAARKFPASVPLGPGSVGWIEAEIEAWAKERVAERDSRLQQLNQSNQAAA